MSLYALGDHKAWNLMLQDCYKKKDINRLLKINYQLQAGMDDLVKKGLNKDEIIDSVFPRWTKSLEDTAKKIYKDLNPNPLDDPIIAADIKKNRPMEYAKHYTNKKSRDAALSNFRKKSSY